MKAYTAHLFVHGSYADGQRPANSWQARLRKSLPDRRSGTIPALFPQKKYIDAVCRMLDRIAAQAIGRTILEEIDRRGFDVTIQMWENWDMNKQCRDGGISPNTAKANSSDAMYLLRQAFASEQAAQVQPELDRTVNAAAGDGCDLARIAALVESDARSLEGWVASGDVPDGKRKPLLRALERWLRPGDGCGVKVRFDPYNELAEPHRRPAYIGLLHELIHCYHNVSGRRLFTDDDQENEHMTIGIAPYDVIALGGARPITENTFRAAVGMGPRNNVG